MRPSDRRIIREVLSAAIAKAAKSEFDRLSAGLRSEDVARNVEYALQQLRILSRGGMPNYADPWVALFYVLWYQPSQINLAYSTIREVLEKNSNKKRSKAKKLQVVDFGAGALATQFGVAIAIAEQERRICAYVDSIDDSDEMLDLGNKVWLRFKRDVSIHHNVHSACQRTKRRRRTSESVERLRKSHRILTAFHAVYDESEEEVLDDLGNLGQVLRTTDCIIATHEYKSDTARRVAPFPMEKLSVDPEFGGPVQDVTSVRKEIWSRISHSAGRECDDPDFVERFLTQWPTSWDWSAAVILTHTG